MSFSGLLSHIEKVRGYPAMRETLHLSYIVFPLMPLLILINRARACRDQGGPRPNPGRHVHGRRPLLQFAGDGLFHACRNHGWDMPREAVCSIADLRLCVCVCMDSLFPISSWYIISLSSPPLSDRPSLLSV